MPIDLSKAVTDRLSACLVVRSAFSKRGSEVAAALVAMVRQHLGEGDEEPDFAAFLIALRRTLQAAIDRLVAADLKLCAAGSREVALRWKRDGLRRRLAQRIVGLRQTALGQWVAPDLEGLGLQALGARDPTTLLRRAELVAVRFQADNLGPMLGRSRFEAPPDLAPFVAEMKQVAGALRGMVVEVNGAKYEVRKARSEKHAAMADYDRIFLHAARLFEDFCRLAGKSDLAARVRPPTARRGGAEQETSAEDPHDAVDRGGDRPPASDLSPSGRPDRSPCVIGSTAAEQPSSPRPLHRLKVPNQSSNRAQGFNPGRSPPAQAGPRERSEHRRAGYCPPPRPGSAWSVPAMPHRTVGAGLRCPPPALNGHRSRLFITPTPCLRTAVGYRWECRWLREAGNSPPYGARFRFALAGNRPPYNSFGPV